MQGDEEQAVAFLEEAADRGCDPACSAHAAWSIHKLAVVAFFDSDLDLAEARLAEAFEAFQALGDKAGLALNSLGRGWVSLLRGDHQQAEALILAGMTDMRELGETLGLVAAHRALGAVARQRGDLDAAKAHLRDGVRLAVEKGTKVELAQCLETLAGVFCAESQPRRAARLFGACQTLGHTIGTEHLSEARHWVEQDILATRSKLGSTAFEAGFAAGKELSLEQAIDLALDDRKDHMIKAGDQALTPLQAKKHKYGGLTAREREVAALIATGMSNRDIAEELVVTKRTVEFHVTNILRKLGFESRTQVAAWAVDRGLASPPKTVDELMREPFEAPRT
jgi:non-specific serine/threonine protein kinase